MDSQVLIQFIDNVCGSETQQFQVPLSISHVNLCQIIEKQASLFIDGTQITSTLEEALKCNSFDFNLEKVIRITFVKDSPSSRPALFCSSSFSGHEQSVLCLRLHKNRMVSGGGDCTVRFWDVTTKTQYRVQKVHTHWVTSIDVCSDFVVAGGMDGKICTFSWEGDFLASFVGHKRGISRVRIGKDEEGKYFIVSAGRDGSVITWDEKGRSLYSYSHGGPVDEMILEDEKIISCGRDNRIKVYAKGILVREIKSHSKRINTLAINKRYFVSGGDDYKVMVYRVEKQDFVKHKEMLHKNIVTCVSISENSLFIASSSFDKTVRVWDANTGNMLMSYFHASAVYKIIFRNNLLISSGKDKTLKTYCVKKKKVLSELVCGDEIFDLDYNEDVLACACRDKKVYFFN